MHTFTPHTNEDGISFSLSVSSDTVRDLEVGVSAGICLIIQKYGACQTHALAVNTAPEAAAAAFVSVAAALEVVLDAAAALVLAKLVDAAAAFVFDALLELLPTTPFEAAPVFFLSVAMLVSSFFLEFKSLQTGNEQEGG